MDSCDLNTHLPPRKRLLAGLKKKNSSDCDLRLPVAPVSSDLYARFRVAATSAQEEIIEESRSAALAAAEAAAKARATAVEKAAAAVNARVAARSALELLDLIATNREGCLAIAKNKLKKKHVPIKLLYKNKRSAEICETDEKLAWRMRRAMISSPGSSNNSRNKHRSYGEAVISDDNSVCDENSRVLIHSISDHLVRGVKDRGTIGSKKVRLL